MKFNDKYNQEDFLRFLHNFLPADFSKIEKDDVVIDKNRYKKIRKAKILGVCKSLDLYVLEMEHESENDPRVAIATDAFKILADHWIHKALVIFKSKKSKNYRLSFLTISLDLNEKNNRAVRKYSNARRYSFYLGPVAKIKTPEQQLIKKGQVKDMDDLLSRFSLEVVNKQFYFEIAKSFDELVSDDLKNLILPSQTNINTRKNFAVRLIGRLMFCWFLKQKKSDSGQLVPDELLSSKIVKNNYYHNILERLFFEVLNTNITERDIRNEFYDKVPYLNGGLFSPQNEDYYDLDHIVGASKYINTLKISDKWFKDFFELLETYNFTIDENTVFDQELSVDPEMLGRIFENLLAEINPETGSSERKRTGSFYTPRQIVEYMVDQSLIEYLKTKTGVKDEKLSALLSYDEDDDLKYPLTDNDKQKIVGALESLKILDPACGSGAFPMGVLQKIVYILQIVDPSGALWRSKKLETAPELYRQKIEEEFDSQTLDYIRKLEVIKNSIFGIDIQPIAVEVSRLRCFLTLVVESEIDDTKKNRGIQALPNLDFKFVCANTLIPAPEQEINTENHLFSDDFQEKLADAVDKYFSSAGENKISAGNEIHKLINEKVDEKYRHLKNLVSYGGDRKIEEIRAKTNKKQIDQHARILALWGSYKNIFENKPVEFFETKYFFPSVKEGFDIVIGNPPYIQLQKFSGQDIQKQYENAGYQTFKKTGDIYALFYERGLEMTKKQTGLLCFITSNKWMRSGYGESLRRYFSENNPLRLLDFGGFRVFESATVDTNILLIQNRENQNKLKAVSFKNDFKKDNQISEYVEKNKMELKNLSSDTWFIGSQREIDLKKKIEEKGMPLKDWDVKIYRGILTGLNEAFIIDEKTKNELIRKDPKSEEIIKPILRGRDIKRYRYEFAGLWILATEFDIDIPKLYPAVFEWLKRFENKLKKRDDQGKNWWNLRSCVYYKEFEKEKIMYSEIVREPQFYLDQDRSLYSEATSFLMTGKNLKYLIAILNSKFFTFIFKFYYSGGNLGQSGYRYKKKFLENVPIPKISPEQQKPFINLVEQILEKKKHNPAADTGELEREIDGMVYELYGLSEEEIKIIEN